VPACQEFDGCDQALIDIGSTCTMYWKDRFNTANLFTYTVAGLPPAESKIWHMEMGNDYLQQIIDEGDYDVIIPAGVITTPEMFLSTGERELKSVADIKGLKIRTAGDDGVILSRMGAAVVFLPSSEVYESMQRGVIDAFQLSSPAMDWSLSTYEIAKNVYLSPVRQPCEWLPIMFSSKSWAELDDGLKSLCINCAHAEGWRYLAEMTQLDVQAVKDFQAYGTNIVTIPKDIEDELYNQALILYGEESAKDPFYKEVFDSIVDFQTTMYATFPRL